MRRFLGQKKYITLLFLIFLLLAVPITILFLRKQNDFRTKAQTPISTATQLSWNAGNYMENLIDNRYNLLTFSLDGINSDNLPAIHFTEDSARTILAFAEEEKSSPIVRLESIKHIINGLISSQIPSSSYQGTQLFLRREQGVFEDLDPGQRVIASDTPDNYLQQDYRYDNMEHVTKVGFNAVNNGTVLEASNFTRQSQSDKHLTPTTLSTTYSGPLSVQLNAKFWRSDYDLALSYQLIGTGAQSYEFVVDKFTDPGQWFGKEQHSRATEIAYKASGQIITASAQSAPVVTIENPAFQSLFIQGKADHALDPVSATYQTFESHMLVGWKGHPSRVIIEGNGNVYKKIRIQYNSPSVNEGFFIVPFDLIDPKLSDFTWNIAYNISLNGTYGMKGFDPVRPANGFGSIPAGFAAAAWELKKYNDPLWQNTLTLARQSLDTYINQEAEGLRTPVNYYHIAAAQYLSYFGEPYKSYYTVYLRQWADRIISLLNSDGSGVWFDQQVMNMVALRRAYEVTQDVKYKNAYEKALGTISVSPDGKITWRGNEIDYNDQTLAAKLTGMYGVLDPSKLPILMNRFSRFISVKGWGEYGNSDLNPYILGKLTYFPGDTLRTITKTGDYPQYEENGTVKLTYTTISNNPFGYTTTPLPNPTIPITPPTSPTITITATPTPTLIQTPTPIPPTPTNTPLSPILPIPSGSTAVSLSLLLHGLGKGGDSANPNGGGNLHPLHPQRAVTVELLNSNNQPVATKSGTVNFNSTAGNFTGSVDLGNTLTTGAYTVKVKSDQFLRALVPGIQTITQSQSNTLPPTTLTTGDMNNNNRIDVLDYNILSDCYSDFAPALNCSDPMKKQSSDITDDGSVNQFDYNLFLRELNNVLGE